MEIQSTISYPGYFNSKEEVYAESKSEEQDDAISESKEQVDAVSEAKACREYSFKNEFETIHISGSQLNSQIRINS